MVLWRFSVVVLIGLLGVSAMVAGGIPNGHSAGFNYSWAVQYSETYGSNSPIPRYLPGLWAGFGGYDFFFYGPLPFWFNAALVAPLCVGCSVETEFVFGAALLLVFSGVTFYLFLRRFFDTFSSAIGSFGYAILPYHLLTDWFERQAAGEFAAYVFIPLIALGYEAIRNNERRGWLLAVGVAGTALCHLPTALLAAHVFGVVGLVLAWNKKVNRVRPLNYLSRLVVWGAVGGLLASFYWLPAFVLLNEVSPGFLYGDYFVAERWLYGLAFQQPNPDFAVFVFLNFLVVFPFLVASLFVARGILRLWIVIPVAFSVIMNLEISELLWQNWIIARVQFPWRLMVFIDFAAALALTVLVKHRAHRFGKLLLIAATVVALRPATDLVNKSNYFKKMTVSVENNMAWLGAVEYLSPEMVTVLKRRLGADRNNAWNFNSIINEMAAMAKEFETSPANFAPIASSPRRIAVVPNDDIDRLSVPIQYWFLWHAEMVGGVALETISNPQFGTLDVIAPEEGFLGRPVTIKLRYHWSEKIGFAVSSLMLLLVIAVACRSESNVLRRYRSNN